MSLLICNNEETVVKKSYEMSIKFLISNFLLGVPPRFARGRRPVASPRAQAVGTHGGKKSLQARFFAAASPAASALAGFPPKRLTQPKCSHKASYETI